MSEIDHRAKGRKAGATRKRRIIKQDQRRHMNKLSGDPFAAELNYELEKAERRRYKPKVRKGPRFKLRQLVARRSDFFNDRTSELDEMIDADRDMAGIVALERALLYVSLLWNKGLGYRDAHVFMLCCGPAACTVRQAADLMSITYQNVRQRLDKLEANGYIEMVRDAENPSLLQSRLTEKGGKLRRYLKDFSTSDMGDFAKLLQHADVKRVHRDINHEDMKRMQDDFNKMTLDF